MVKNVNCLILGYQRKIGSKQKSGKSGIKLHNGCINNIRKYTRETLIELFLNAQHKQNDAV